MPPGDFVAAEQEVSSIFEAMRSGRVQRAVAPVILPPAATSPVLPVAESVPQATPVDVDSFEAPTPIVCEGCGGGSFKGIICRRRWFRRPITRVTCSFCGLRATFPLGSVVAVQVPRGDTFRLQWSA